MNTKTVDQRIVLIATADTDAAWEIDYKIALYDGWYADMWPPIVGIVTLRKVNRHIQYVCKLELRPASRKQHLWPLVHEAVCDEARRLGASHLLCTVRDDNPHIENLKRNYTYLTSIAGVSQLFIKRL